MDETALARRLTAQDERINDLEVALRTYSDGLVEKLNELSATVNSLVESNNATVAGLEELIPKLLPPEE